MADFCKQCSIELFGEDSKDLANINPGEKLEEGYGFVVLCEGCLMDDRNPSTLVNHDGECISSHCTKHSKK